MSQTLEHGQWFKPPVIKEHTISKEPHEPGVHIGTSLSLKEYASRLYIPFFKDPVWTFSGFSLLLMAFFMFFVITGSSNAANLTDGLDGLLAGCLIMVAGSLGVIAFVSDES